MGVDGFWFWFVECVDIVEYGGEWWCGGLDGKVDCCVYFVCDCLVEVCQFCFVGEFCFDEFVVGEEYGIFFVIFDFFGFGVIGVFVYLGMVEEVIDFDVEEVRFFGVCFVDQLVGCCFDFFDIQFVDDGVVQFEGFGVFIEGGVVGCLVDVCVYVILVVDVVKEDGKVLQCGYVYVFIENVLLYGIVIEKGD